MTALRAASIVLRSNAWCATTRLSRRALTAAVKPDASTPAEGGDAAEKEWLEPYLRAPQAGAPVIGGLTARQRRIMFRSRQRGWLELDVLLGSWAAKNVPAMTDEHDIGMVEDLLALETPHLYKWIVGQDEPPPELDNKILRSLQEFAGGSGVVENR
jgi:succinate dehydrogenase flavin-adding protein (antitoxin of CptAB toxin-antitoxin module)